MALDDLSDDDLIGGSPPRQTSTERRRGANGVVLGRPTREEKSAQLAEQAAAQDKGKIALPDVSMFYRPVGVKFLADVFRKEQRTVLKKLMKCPIVEYANERGRTVPKWDFVVAAGYLVEPKIDLESWIRSQRVQDLPPHINDQFWKAMRSRQAWEKEAKHTWNDADVLEVLGATAMMIRDVTLLWVDELPDKADLSTENYHAMRERVTDLLKQVQEKLVEIPKTRRTESTVRNMDEVLQGQDDAALADNYELDDAALADNYELDDEDMVD